MKQQQTRKEAVAKLLIKHIKYQKNTLTIAKPLHLLGTRNKDRNGKRQVWKTAFGSRIKNCAFADLALSDIYCKPILLVPEKILKLLI